MRKPKLRELGEALKVLFIEGPYTASFPREATIPPKSFRGKPAFDPDICIGCGACSQVCPSRSIEIIDDIVARKRTLKLHYDLCNFCGLCHLACTTKDGIDYTEEYDLAGFSRDDMTVEVEKELAICEICGQAAGTVDHLIWLAKRLGPLGYANPSLILTDQANLGQTSEIHARSSDCPVGRADLFRILCPECRRKAFMTEEW